MVLLDVAYTAMGTNLTRQFTRVVYHWTLYCTVHTVHCKMLHSIFRLLTVDWQSMTVCCTLCSGFALCTAVFRQAHCQYTVPKSINYAHYSVLSLLPLSLQCICSTWFAVHTVLDRLLALPWWVRRASSKKTIPVPKDCQAFTRKGLLPQTRSWSKMVFQRRKWRQSDGMQPTMSQSETFQDRESFVANFEWLWMANCWKLRSWRQIRQRENSSGIFPPTEMGIIPLRVKSRNRGNLKCFKVNDRCKN